MKLINIIMKNDCNFKCMRHIDVISRSNKFDGKFDVKSRYYDICKKSLENGKVICDCVLNDGLPDDNGDVRCGSECLSEKKWISNLLDRIMNR